MSRPIFNLPTPIPIPITITTLQALQQKPWKVTSAFRLPHQDDPGVENFDILRFKADGAGGIKITRTPAQGREKDWAYHCTQGPEGVRAIRAVGGKTVLLVLSGPNQLTCNYLDASAGGRLPLDAMGRGAVSDPVCKPSENALAEVVAALPGTKTAAKGGASETCGGNSGAVFVAESGGSGVPQEPPPSSSSHVSTK